MVGAGYVGLVTAVCLADAGVDVRLLDIDPGRLEILRQGKAPIHEPQLDGLLAKVLKSGHLVLFDKADEAMRGAAVIMIAVGTPPLSDGRADLMQVRAALSEAVRHAGPETVIAIKSTVPPGTTASLLALPAQRPGGAACRVPGVPRRGQRGARLPPPPQVVIGGDDHAAASALRASSGTSTRRLGSPTRPARS